MAHAERSLLPIEFERLQVPNSPESLFRLCLKDVSRDLETLQKYLTLSGGLILPSDICDQIVEMYQRNGYVVCKRFVSVFSDVTKTRLKSLVLYRSSISDDDFEYLLQHDLYDIKLFDCLNLTGRSYINIFKHAENLRSLNITPNRIPSFSRHQILASWEPDDGSLRFSKNPAPNLKRIVLQQSDCTLHNMSSFLDIMLADFCHLKILDISHSLDLQMFFFLSGLKNLHTLIMFNVPYLEEKGAIPIICSLQSLVVLDISQTESYVNSGIFEYANRTLELLIKSLPNLMHLDISGTNLDGCGGILNNLESLRGLQCRVDNPLEFLGLYRTKHNACQQQNIPAKIISGDANEEQLLNAAASCMKKPAVMEYILKDIFSFMLIFNLNEKDKLLNITLDVLTINVYFKPIQVFGNKILSYLVEEGDTDWLLDDISVIRRIVTIISTAIDNYGDDEELMCSALSILMNLDLPQDIMFQFKSVVRLLLKAISSNFNHQFYFHKVGIQLLQTIICAVNDNQRREIGDAGAITEFMKLIEDGLNRTVCNYIFENSWLCMWFLCNENPSNCERFLIADGMKYFLRFFVSFPEKKNLLKIILGALIANFAKWKKLQPWVLQHYDSMKVFLDLLISTSHGIEINFYAARIIVNLFYDGNETWPERQKALDYLTQAITNWEKVANKLANFPFNPMDSLLCVAQVRRVPQCTYWAAWTLANLTRLKPKKHCSDIIAKGGLNILRDLLEEPEITKNLAQQSIKACEKFLKRSVKRRK